MICTNPFDDKILIDLAIKLTVKVIWQHFSEGQNMHERSEQINIVEA